MDRSLTFLPASHFAALIRSREIRCLELLDHCIARVERLDPRTNGVVVRDFDRARVRPCAGQPIRRSARLYGAPMTIKDNFDVNSLPTTWDAPAYRDTKTARDALAVDRMLNARVMLFGKTNVPRMLADRQSYNDSYGATNNPWDVTSSAGDCADGTTIQFAKLLEIAWHSFVPPPGWE